MGFVIFQPLKRRKKAGRAMKVSTLNRKDCCTGWLVIVNHQNPCQWLYFIFIPNLIESVEQIFDFVVIWDAMVVKWRQSYASFPPFFPSKQTLSHRHIWIWLCDCNVWWLCIFSRRRYRNHHSRPNAWVKHATDTERYIHIVITSKWCCHAVVCIMLTL